MSAKVKTGQADLQDTIALYMNFVLRVVRHDHTPHSAHQMARVYPSPLLLPSTMISAMAHGFHHVPNCRVACLSNAPRASPMEFGMSIGGRTG